MKNSFGFGNWHAICNSSRVKVLFLLTEGENHARSQPQSWRKDRHRWFDQVEIVSLDRGKVRIGITAPSEVSVHRKEVLDRIHEFAEPASARPSFAAFPAKPHSCNRELLLRRFRSVKSRRYFGSTAEG